ncbi:MAG TPA: DUF2270 domain-containing protein [Fredinandcohnia sp.]|nr:DUF2270 domain-containing protein [Fredinandcohnia sp.]
MRTRERPLASQPLPGLDATTLAHIYRAEVSRSTQWRIRLDITTNWAVTITAAVVSYAFGNREAPSGVLIVGFFAVATFLVIEARRYRYYDIWARRVRMIEAAYLVPLARREPVTVDFFSALAAELSWPRLRIGALQSVAFRMQRATYPLALGVLLGAYVIKLYSHPTTATRFADVLERARVGFFPGWLVFGFWACTVIGYFALLYYASVIPLPPTELRAPTRQRPVPLGAVFRAVQPEVTVPRAGPGARPEGE